ncbi:MAG: hypothetical protein ABJA02_10490 [Acidobacteriota bacterium]
MPVVEIKNPNERNKLIAAAILGVVALAALYFAFGRGMFSSSTSVNVKVSTTPKPSATPAKDTFKLPTKEEQTFDNVTTPVVYTPGSSSAPDAGRNIFAFYEPPVPTPYSPTPIPPVKTPPPPTPTPTPDILVAAVNPPNVFAGAKSFRLELNGDHFTPDSHIYWSQTEMPTTYVSPQRIYADIPSNLITQDGPRQIIVQTPDGKKYSNQMILTVQAPPVPSVQYIGMIGRKRYNNDTAYFLETGKTTPFGARLNDVVGGRFRLINIAPAQVMFEDTSLGFKHTIALTQPTASGTSSTGGSTSQPVRPVQPDGGFTPFNPNTVPSGEIPGIPNNIPRYVPPQPNQAQPQPGSKQDRPKKDVDDNDDGDGE